MPAVKIYKSHHPSMYVPEQSVFSTVLPEKDPYDPNIPAFIDAATGRSVSRKELRDLSLQVGWALTDGDVLPQHGGPQLRRGAVLGIYSPNSLSFVLGMYAGFAAGFKVSPANSNYTPPELAHQLSNSGASVVLAHPTLLKPLFEAFEIIGVSKEEARKRIILGAWEEKLDEPLPTGFLKIEDFMGKGKMAHEARFDGRYSHETALLCYSSGTTGRSKGVETSHKNLVAVITLFPVAWPKCTPGVDKMLGVLPGYHIYAAVKVVLFPIAAGLATVLLRKYEPATFGQAIQQYKVTYAPVVPPILVQLSNNPIFDQFDFTSVKMFTSGGAPLGPDLVRAVMNKMKLLGGDDVAVSQGFGLTETSPTSHFNPREYALSRAGTVGPLLPNIEARLVNDDGEDVAEDDRGELWLRGPTIMKGYLHNPIATLDSITPDGWFQTGDIAIRDADGWFSIVDRKKELIKYKGFQVPPADLEALLLTHNDIVDSGCIGVYDASQATELPRAYIVPRGGLESFKTAASRKAFQDAVAKWVTTKVAPHKFLRGGVVLTDVIPKSAAGKILRKELRERAKAELEKEPLPTKSRL